MAKYYDEIPQWLFEWIKKQHMFFVATAPLSDHGHVNVSPKGTADCLHVVNPKRVWYEDLTGSGIETISHIRENGRITVMFCALEGPPRILRLWGIGAVHEFGSDEYIRLIPPTSRKPGSRAVIVVDIYQVGSSCGYAVPLYDFVTHRTQLLRHFDKLEGGDRKLAGLHEPRSEKDDVDPPCATDVVNAKESGRATSLRTYWLIKNARSLDGLPGLLTAPDAVLNMTPQSNSDKVGGRPMLRRRSTPSGSIIRDSTWFASGFVLGGVAVYAITGLITRLKR